VGPVLLLLVSLHAQDPVRVRATLTDEEIHAGETTVLKVDVETDGRRARIERFRTLPPGLELEGTRDFDQRQFSMPGGTRRFITREFVLRARAAGRFRIPSVDVVVDEGVYETGSMILTVTSPAARERGETREGPDGVLLRAWLDADTVFVGEQVTLQVEALFSQEARLRLRRAPEYEPPSPSGFWIHDLPDRSSPVTTMVGDEVFEMQRFRRAFFPLSPGDYTIPPAHLEYEMRRGLLYAPETHEIASDPMSLIVLPVPPEQPPEFTGAVGRYTMTAWLEPATVPVGEAAVLTVEVEGTGNVKALPPPVLPRVAGLDVYPPAEEATTEARGATIRGRKEFSWVLIPRQAGDHGIPEIRYAYFDPEAGSFETTAVAPLTLSASPGAVSDDAPAVATLRYLKTRPSDGDPLAWVRSGWFAAAQGVPLLLLAAALGWRRGWGRRDGFSSGALRRRRRRGVRELEQRVADPDDPLFGDTELFAREWLGDRLGGSPRTVSSAARLEAAGVTADTARAVAQIMERISAARYAPTPPGLEARRDIVRALGRVLQRVDREAPSAKARSGRAAATAGIAVFLVAAAVPAADAQTDSFAEGLRAFDQARYRDAAQTFDRYVEAHPGDPAGWYNLGTAYHRAGLQGYAVWAWLHVPRLDPRDGDVRHNLRVAGVPPELVSRVAPPIPLRSTEQALLAALAWLITGVAGAIWLARRRRLAGWTAMAAAGVAILLAGAWWASTTDAETLIVLEAATLRAGPALREEPVVELEPGIGLAPVSRYGDWLRARTLGGQEGWIESGATGRI
jgi:hypothetical protein